MGKNNINEVHGPQGTLILTFFFQSTLSTPLMKSMGLKADFLFFNYIITTVTPILVYLREGSMLLLCYSYTNLSKGGLNWVKCNRPEGSDE